MTDIVPKRTRSTMMSGIRGANTQPELALRSALHQLGFRYRLHDKQLPGKPDIVLPKYRAIILVNGCFWHGHSCHLFKWPKTRSEFWREKIEGNRARDKRNLAMYNNKGWKTLIVWECALKGRTKIGITQVAEIAARWIQFDSHNAEIRGSNH